MKNYLLRLVDYEQWANRAIIDALGSVASPPHRAVELMGHVLSAQQVWMSRLTGEISYVAIWEDIPIAWMGETSDRNFQRLKSFLEGESEDKLTQTIAYKTSTGEPFESPLTDILLHLSHHAAYHRGQIVQLIRPQLTEAPKTDYIFWART
ncbi:DinB family protein [Larkinella rosea]|uniref:Damage-inducible protein DinB n=1 Tax=Larkinella rosea TaxID=2025312 RepID=A0A3P1BFC9_9BACT|nr:DinB family protein [Larkinella rosea]RRA99769.1 damage-inducible protein DinB [Larkinella rosea]